MGIPEGSLRKELKRLLGIRSLTRVARLSIREQAVELLNETEKTVFRFDLTNFFADRESQEPFYRLCHLPAAAGLRGRGDKSNRDLADDRSHRDCRGSSGYVFSRGWKSSPAIHAATWLRFGARFVRAETARRIISRILAIARENESGIIDDIDTEFLHDYRICVRKIRSVLSLIKGVYPEEKPEELKAAFSSFARSPIACVTSMSISSHRAVCSNAPGRAPAASRRDVSGLCQGASSRLEEGRRASWLSRLPCRDRGDGALFAGPSKLPETEVSQNPVGPLVAGRIYKSYKRIVKIERSLGVDTPDEAVHQVRIQCKSYAT